MDITLIVITLVLGFVGLSIFLVWLIKSLLHPQQLQSLVQQVHGISANTLQQQAQAALKDEREKIASNLQNQQQLFDKTVAELRAELKQRQVEIRQLEQDRQAKFSALATTLQQQQELTKELQVTTNQLTKVLSNNQTRGGWGERIIEDLMQANGMVEGVHYARQQSLGNSEFKPDITLLLPDQRVVAVDVKFPYQALQKMMQVESQAAQKAHLQEFKRDVKTKLQKVAKYILPSEHTLDYAIMFVPNEAIFSFINQQLSEIVDEAFQKRVLLVSPFTFVVVARTVMESYRNFMLESNLRQIVSSLEDFNQEWQKYRQQVDKFGRAIESMQRSFEDLAGTRTNQLEKKLQAVQQMDAQLASKKEHQ